MLSCLPVGVSMTNQLILKLRSRQICVKPSMIFQGCKMSTAEKNLSQLWARTPNLWKMVSDQFFADVQQVGGSSAFPFPFNIFKENILLISSRKKKRKKSNLTFSYFLSAQRTNRVNCKNKMYKSLFYFCMRQQDSKWLPFTAKMTSQWAKWTPTQYWLGLL